MTDIVKGAVCMHVWILRAKNLELNGLFYGAVLRIAPWEGSSRGIHRTVYFYAPLVTPSRFCHNKQPKETLSKWKLTYLPVSFDIKLLRQFLATCLQNSVHMLQGWPVCEFWAECRWWMVQERLLGRCSLTCLVTSLMCHSDGWKNSWKGHGLESLTLLS